MIIFATMTTFLAGLILHEPLPSLAHNCVSEVGEKNTQTPPPPVLRIRIIPELLFRI